MRSLKFRAWDTEQEEWIITTALEVFSFSGELSSVYDARNEHTVIQQFTGVEDSNGKEIYEGDIIKDSWKENQPYGYSPEEWSEEEMIFVVKFEAPAFTFPNHNNSQNCLEDFRRKVIGNIFENPDLIS